MTPTVHINSKCDRKSYRVTYLMSLCDGTAGGVEGNATVVQVLQRCETKVCKIIIFTFTITHINY